jgi:hypothetical protein
MGQVILHHFILPTFYGANGGLVSIYMMPKQSDHELQPQRTVDQQEDGHQNLQ